MSIKVITYVWENSKADGSALLLLLAIADHAHDDGGGAYPSVETLAAKCRQSERNTQLLLRKLEDMGEITTALQAGPRGCNVYTIPVPGGEKIAGVKSSARGVKSSVRGGEIQRTRGVKPIAPEPSLNRQIEPSKNLYSEPPEIEVVVEAETNPDSVGFAALYEDVTRRMGELKPRETEILGWLWDEYNDIDAHLFALGQADKYADSFNLKYYESCLKSWWHKHRSTDNGNSPNGEGGAGIAGYAGEGRPNGAVARGIPAGATESAVGAAGAPILPRLSHQSGTGAGSDSSP